MCSKRCVSKDQYLRAQLAGISTEKIRITDSSTAGADVVDLSLSHDIYVLYGPYMVKEAGIVKQQLIKLGEEVKLCDN